MDTAAANKIPAITAIVKEVITVTMAMVAVRRVPDIREKVLPMVTGLLIRLTTEIMATVTVTSTGTMVMAIVSEVMAAGTTATATMATATAITATATAKAAAMATAIQVISSAVHLHTATGKVTVMEAENAGNTVSGIRTMAISPVNPGIILMSNLKITGASLRIRMQGETPDCLN
jgi:hypothetical protein